MRLENWFLYCNKTSTYVQIYCSLYIIALLRVCQKFVFLVKSVAMLFGTIGYKGLTETTLKGTEDMVNPL